MTRCVDVSFLVIFLPRESTFEGASPTSSSTRSRTGEKAKALLFGPIGFCEPCERMDSVSQMLHGTGLFT